jgi:hypothetical protein
VVRDLHDGRITETTAREIYGAPLANAAE